MLKHRINQRLRVLGIGSPLIMFLFVCYVGLFGLFGFSEVFMDLNVHLFWT